MDGWIDVCMYLYKKLQLSDLPKCTVPESDSTAFEPREEGLKTVPFPLCPTALAGPELRSSHQPV